MRKTLTLELPIKIKRTAKEDGFIIKDAKGTDFFFYEKEDDGNLEYDGWDEPIDKEKRDIDPAEN